MRLPLLLLFALSFSWFVTLPSLAQRKQIGEARTYLKSGKNFDKAEKLMTDLLKDSANLNNRRIYEIWFQSVKKQYEQANERLYVKKQQDTAQFFSLVKRMFTVAFRLDSVDAYPDKKGRVNPTLRKSLSSEVNSYRSNLFFGGAYYVRKADFQTAFDYFETYLDCRRQPLFTGYDLEKSDSRMGEAAYWATYSAYRLGDPVRTLRYRCLAQRDTTRLERTLLYHAEAWRQLKDDSSYVATLGEGFERYPLSNYFYPRLIDWYNKGNQPEEALKVTEKALEKAPSNPLFLLAKADVLLRLERYDESLRYSNLLIAVNDSLPEAYFNAGTALLNKILTLNARTQKKEIRRLYQQAKPYLEQYRALAPKERQKWGPALYRVYLNLNMGKQFDEIDRLLRSK